ncbi:MAG: GNAT family N-acetyltransferase, partial [Candidatus Heimdallarchaeota archaeon]
MKITNMTKKHIPEVIDVLAAAFSDSSLKRRGKTRDRKRLPEGIIPYLELGSEGCFIAKDQGKIIGAIFSHLWGKIGWIGTFAVHPDAQAKGVGKKLMLKAIDYLDRERNVINLSLETMSDSKENIGFYSKLGFKPAFPTISLTRPIISSSLKDKEIKVFSKKNNLEISYFSEEDNKDDAYTRCSWLAGKLENGLDHSIVIKIAEDYNFGKTIFIKREGFIIGYAICHLKPRYEQTEPDTTLTIKIIILDKDNKEPELLDYILYACEQFGLENGKTDIKVAINSSYWLTYNRMLNNGFRVRGILMRM